MVTLECAGKLYEKFKEADPVVEEEETDQAMNYFCMDIIDCS